MYRGNRLQDDDNGSQRGEWQCPESRSDMEKLKLGPL